MSSSFGINVLKILTSRIAAQAISFISAPIIARVYLPEHFGALQLFTSISGVIIVISCLRYEFSIPLGRNKAEVISSVIISILSSLTISLISFVFVIILKGKVSIWLKSPELETFLWFLPLTVLLSGISHALNYYASCQGIFGAIAWSNFGLASGNIFVTITLGLIFGAYATFLFAGNIAGIILNILITLFFLYRRFSSDVKNANLSFSVIWKVVKYYKKFPIFDVWGALFNSISIQLPPIILGAYFSTTIVGYYSFGNRFVGLPMMLFGISISQVFFPTAAKEYNDTGKLTNVVNDTFKRLIQIGVFPFMILGFFSAPLFGFFFGKNWVEAGIYTQILSIYVLLQFISSPLSTVFSISKRQGTLLLLTSFQLIIRIMAIVLFAQFNDPKKCLIAFSVASSVFYILMLYFVCYLSKSSFSLAVKIFSKYMVISLILLLPVLFLTRIINNVYFLLVTLVIDAIIYIYILYRIDLKIHAIIHNVKRRLSK